MSQQQNTDPALVAGYIKIKDYYLLVEVIAPQEKIGSILKPDSVKERDKYRITYGHIRMKGLHCFEDMDFCAEVGDFVEIPPYSGSDEQHKDGKFYRLVADKDILSIRDREHVVANVSNRNL